MQDPRMCEPLALGSGAAPACVWLWLLLALPHERSPPPLSSKSHSGVCFGWLALAACAPSASPSLRSHSGRC